MCNNILSRARIVGGSDTRSSVKLMEILRLWKSADGTFLFTHKIRRRVWVDKHCPLQIDSLFASTCDSKE